MYRYTARRRVCTVAYAHQRAVWFNDMALHDRLRVRADRDGLSMTALVQNALRAFLDAPDTAKPAATPVKAPVAKKPVKKAAAPSPVAVATAADPICRRCGHPKTKHFPDRKTDHAVCQMAACACRGFAFLPV
jgi:hypothetical protein